MTLRLMSAVAIGLVVATALWLAACAVGMAGKAANMAPSEPMVEHRAGMIDEPVFGGRMYLFTAGPLEPVETVDTVVLVHGLSTEGAGDWRHVVPELARRRQVISFDLPGFARSHKQDTLYSLERYSELLHALIADWARGPVTLVGHSLGGALVLYHAQAWPDDVERLVVVDTAGVLYRTAYLKYIASLRDAGLLSASPDLEEGLNDIIGELIEWTEVLPVQTMGEILEDPSLRKKYLKSDPAAVAGAAMMQVDFSQRLSKIRQPTLVLWGEDDEIAPLRTGQVLAARLPDVRLQTIAAAGHAPMLDQPAEFNRRLLAALEQWPPADPIVLPPQAASSLVGICEGEDDLSFVGDYAELRIEGCDRVQIRDGAIGRIEIESGSADLHNVRIDAEEIGLSVKDSNVTLTNVRIEASTALLVDGSRVDLASVELVGESDAVRTIDEASLVFSVCTIRSPHGSGTLHGAFEFTKGSRL